MRHLIEDPSYHLVNSPNDYKICIDSFLYCFTGRIITTEDGIEVLLSLENVYIIGIPNPKPGIWHLQVSSTGVHTLRVTAKSQLDFSYGFSKTHTWDLDETMRRPIKGETRGKIVWPGVGFKVVSLGAFICKILINFRGGSAPMPPSRSATGGSGWVS